MPALQITITSFTYTGIQTSLVEASFQIVYVMESEYMYLIVLSVFKLMYHSYSK